MSSKNPAIESTCAYDIFKSIDGNRAVSNYAVKNLKNAIKKDNQLRIHPILVDENMRVIDGQHRLEAARQLAIPIYYIKSDVDESHFISANANQKTFTAHDYMIYHCKNRTNSSYDLLYEISNKYSLSVRSALYLFFDNVNNETHLSMKQGTLQIPSDWEKHVLAYERIYTFFVQRKIKPISMIKGTSFLNAFNVLLGDLDFDLDKFMQKLSVRWFEFKPCRNVKDWIAMLLEIYNYRSKDPMIIKVEECSC